MEYFIHTDKLNKKLLFFAGFAGEPVQVSKYQYWFLTICGFVGYRKVVEK